MILQFYYLPPFNFSGSSLMHGMIPRPMHTTLQCHACLEGEGLSVLIILDIYVHVLHSTHKIIGISTISRADHATAQTRELACTKVVLPQVIDRGQLLYVNLEIFM